METSSTIVEFYSSCGTIAFVETTAVPPMGATVFINSKKFTVQNIRYAIDTSGLTDTMRVVVDIE